ncbi:MAG: cyclase family protein [Candidatus Eremiobacteraeota bacterium]|nr:cyclase family protein [Candidatus Eremiobacteraeota bacterium]
MGKQPAVIVPKRIYDLSQPVFSNCPQYPDKNPRPAIVKLLYMQQVQGVNKEIVEISTHTGTHCDAPYHFFDEGKTIDEIPLENYVAPAIVADVRHKRAGCAIETADIAELPVESGQVVLFNTGWGHKRANTAEFLTQYVYLSGEAAEHLVRLGVAGVGIDAVSLGGYNDPAKAGPAHRAMLGAGKFIVEELFFPEEIMDGKERLFVALPVKLKGCGGAWTRASLWEL